MNFTIINDGKKHLRFSEQVMSLEQPTGMNKKRWVKTPMCSMYSIQSMS